MFCTFGRDYYPASHGTLNPRQTPTTTPPPPTALQQKKMPKKMPKKKCLDPPPACLSVSAGILCTLPSLLGVIFFPPLGEQRKSHVASSIITRLRKYSRCRSSRCRTGSPMDRRFRRTIYSKRHFRGRYASLCPSETFRRVSRCGGATRKEKKKHGRRTTIPHSQSYSANHLSTPAL